MKPFYQLFVFILLLHSCSGINTEKATSFDDFTAGVEVGDPGKMPKKLLIAMKSGKKDVFNLDVSISLDSSLKDLNKQSEFIKILVYKIKGSKKITLKQKVFKTPIFPISLTLSIEDLPLNNKNDHGHYLIVAELSSRGTISSGYGLIEIKRKGKTKKSHQLSINQPGLYPP